MKQKISQIVLLRARSWNGKRMDYSSIFWNVGNFPVFLENVKLKHIDFISHSELFEDSVMTLSWNRMIGPIIVRY